MTPTLKKELKADRGNEVLMSFVEWLRADGRYGRMAQEDVRSRVPSNET